jgi:teichoic acid transport system permease protein
VLAVTAPAAVATRGLERIGTPLSLREYLRRMWSRRDFVLTVPIGQLKAQNQNSLLGSAWHLLNPLLLAGVFYLVFGVLFDAQRDIDHFAAYLIIGIFVFTYTQKVMMSGARTIIANANLIKTINFPRACLPLAASLGEAAAQGAAFVAMAGVVILTGVLPSPSWLLVLPAFLLQGLFNAGLAFAAARLTFHYRDVEQLLPFVLRLWMYGSGVFFSLEYVTIKADAAGANWLGEAFQLNPLWVFMSLVRGALIGPSPGAGQWALAVAWSAGALVLGFLFFKANETEYGRA